MNPVQGQAPQPGQAQGQQGAAGQQQRPTPMYQPNQIRGMTFLTDDEKNKYENGLRNLWNRANNSPASSPEQIAARQKIIEFSRMLISKIQSRKNQAQQQQQQGQQAGQGGARPMAGQQNNANQPQPAQQQGAGAAGSPGQATANAGQASQVASAAAAAAAAAQRNKIPDTFIQHASKITFLTPPQLSGRTEAEVAKWRDDMRERYARALFTIEQSKTKITGMEKIFKERTAAGKPLQDEELKQYTMRREQQLKAYGEATKWMESVKKQQESLQASNQGGDGAQAGQVSAVARSQNGQQPTPVVDAVKNQQQQAANRASHANGTSTPTGQTQNRIGQAATQQTQVKAEQPQPPALNTAQASAQAQAAGRVQTPQSATTAAAAGQTRALSHSAAMTLANQKAAGAPAAAAGQAQQPGATAPGAAVAMNQSTVGPGALQQQQQQQGHPHAHPSQQQTGFQAKMPIPKQLPERATAVPQGVTVGGGVSAGRPTMSQGSGTLGGVMNQPAVPKVAAYNNDAEGDHVLSKKKLDELVRQVCGGSADLQEGNLLTPEVEESILAMADSFVDNILHAGCRNSKERGSKVLEIRDIQLVLERTYNIRVPGYSSDELRTVRKVLPSAGWIAKMSAVQAAKVMPGKGDL